MKRTLATVLSIVVLSAPPAHAIIMRHDVPDWRYVQLGDRVRGPLVQIALTAQSDGAPMLYSAMGTLIAPDWVLTAAHATEYMQQAPPPGGGPQYVFYKGRGYQVAAVYQHPQYDGEHHANDIALIHLAHPVRAPEPACLFEGADEVGQVATLVGSGLYGNGRDGPQDDPDGRVRGSTVRVGTGDETTLTWRFHAPGERGVTPLEGISAPGDSGGPAFIQTRAGLCIAGISSSQRIDVQLDANGQPLAHQTGEGHYGVTEVYTRVSHFLPWIRATMAAG